jgi:hypothetical protein
MELKLVGASLTRVHAFFWSGSSPVLVPYNYAANMQWINSYTDIDAAPGLDA